MTRLRDMPYDIYAWAEPSNQGGLVGGNPRPPCVTAGWGRSLFIVVIPTKKYDDTSLNLLIKSDSFGQTGTLGICN